MLKLIESEDSNSHVIDITGNVFHLIECTVSADELWDILFQFNASLKLHAFTYYHIAPAGARDYGNHYFVSRGKNHSALAVYKSAVFDPTKSFLHVAKRCNNSTLFTSTSNFDYLTKDQLNLFKTLHMKESSLGVVIPTHSANGRSGCFVLEAEDNEKGLTEHVVRQLSWVCQAAHTRYSQIRRTNTKAIKKLTTREKQILTWVARGKSNSVIADIIGISQHTVNGYLRSIYLKTGTSDRTTAALRGIGETLIDL